MCLLLNLRWIHSHYAVKQQCSTCHMTPGKAQCLAGAICFTRTTLSHIQTHQFTHTQHNAEQILLHERWPHYTGHFWGVWTFVRGSVERKLIFLPTVTCKYVCFFRICNKYVLPENTVSVSLVQNITFKSLLLAVFETSVIVAYESLSCPQC